MIKKFLLGYILIVLLGLLVSNESYYSNDTKELLTQIYGLSALKDEDLELLGYKITYITDKHREAILIFDNESNKMSYIKIDFYYALNGGCPEDPKDNILDYMKTKDSFLYYNHTLKVVDAMNKIFIEISCKDSIFSFNELPHIANALNSLNDKTDKLVGK